ncbi:hypothetical protein B0O99DRAFT_679831 [Bisporella sp. PMI_857]|nr:hypothetical protein B0O99DRAFT_679831 [Bisporella sp. PMI_857]
MATSNACKLIRMWSLKDNSSIATFDKIRPESHPRLIFTRGNLVAISERGLFYIWNRATWAFEQSVPVSSISYAQAI